MAFTSIQQLIHCVRAGVYNLLLLPSHITFIYTKYGRQWVQVIFMRYV